MRFNGGSQGNQNLLHQDGKPCHVSNRFKLSFKLLSALSLYNPGHPIVPGRDLGGCVLQVASMLLKGSHAVMHNAGSVRDGAVHAHDAILEMLNLHESGRQQLGTGAASEKSRSAGAKPPGR